MSFARLLVAGSMALAVTLGLLLLMHILIQTNIRGPGEVPEYRIPEIVMPDRVLTPERDISRPDRPEDIPPPPPDIPPPPMDTPDVSNEAFTVSLAGPERINIGGPGTFGDGDMIPLTVVQPEYPRNAAQRGVEGYCTVEFTVTSLGTTRDPFIVDCPQRIFERNSLRASERIRYRPRVVDGQPVDVPGVQYRFVFQMAQE